VLQEGGRGRETKAFTSEGEWENDFKEIGISALQSSDGKGK